MKAAGNVKARVSEPHDSAAAMPKGRRAARSNDSLPGHLAHFMETAPIGMYSIKPDGVIDWANAAEYEPLGYTREEFVGHHLSEFHADRRTLDDVLARLGNGESLRDYPARLKCKDGTMRAVRLDANVRHEEGRLIGAQLVTREVPHSAEGHRWALGNEPGSTQSRLPVSAALYLCDEQGRITFYNEAATDLWGRAPDLKKDFWCGWWKLYNADGAPLPTEECPMAICLREGRPVRGQAIIIERPDGTRRPVLPYPDPIKDESGKVIGAVNILVDLVEHERSQEATHVLAAIVQFSSDAIISKSLDGVITSWNAGAERLYGYTAGEAIGQSISILIPPECADEEQRILERLCRGERIEHYETVRLRKDGSRLDVSLTASPIRDSRGQIIGASKIARNITDQKRVEEALRRSEAQFRQLADSMPQIVWAARPDGCTDYFNRRWYELTGASQGKVGDQSFLPYLHPDDRERCLATWYECVRTGKKYEIEYRFRFGATGDYRWHLGRALPVHDASGAIIRWLGTCTDLHERKLAQVALRQQAQTLKILNRVGRELVAQRDAQKIVRIVIEAGCEVSGATCGAYLPNNASAAHAVGGAGRETTGDHSLEAGGESFARFIDGHRDRLLVPIFHGGKSIQIADMATDLGDEKVSEAGSGEAIARVRSYVAVPVASRSGDVLGALCFGHPTPDFFTEEIGRTLSGLAGQAAIAIDNADLYRALQYELAEKRRAAAELRSAQDQLRAHAANLERTVQERTESLRHAVTQLEEFAYSVSHDLRAPLRAMQGFARVLTDEYAAQLNEDARRYLDRIARNGVRMEKLINDILTLSRISRAELRLSRVALDRVIRDIIQQHPEMQPPAAEIVVEPLQEVIGDEPSLVQAISNILNNAVKFVRKGHTPRVRVWTEARETSVRLWVEDNGIGLSEEQRGRIFGMFERVHPDRRYEGTGIGLTIVRKAVERMEGRVGVESDGRTGSRFWIELRTAEQPITVPA